VKPRLAFFGRSASCARAALPVAALVVAASVVYGGLSTFVSAPRVFGDEVIYMDAADSLADGHGLRVQAISYGRGPVYPAVIAPIMVATQNRLSAYFWVKLANALFFALAAIPIYLLARRLLSRRASVLVSLLSIAIPSSAYVGLVMTDSLGYLVSSTSLLAIILALERPTSLRQVAAFASIGLAYEVRPQFIALLPAYVVGLVAVIAAQRSDLRRDQLRRLWPSAALFLLAAVGVIGVLLLRGGSALGDYSFVVRYFSLTGIPRWAEYHLADLALFLGLLPLALLPCLLVALYRRGRAPGSHAFLAVFCAATVFALLVAGVFGSTSQTQGRIYDRYLFYVVPLWLIAVAVWLQEGAPRPRKAAVLGGGLLLAVIAVFPFDTFVVDDASKQLHAAGTPLWAHLGSWATSHGQTGHRAIGAVAILAAGIAYLIPRRIAWTLAPLVATVFVANSAMLWRHDINDWQPAIGPHDTGVRWVDKVVPNEQTVLILNVSGPRCSGQSSTASVLAEFFNDRIDREARLGLPAYGGIPSFSVRVGRNGHLVRASGRVVTTRWVIAPDGVKLRGAPVARGTRQHLVLWHTTGTLTVDAHSDGELQSQACPPTSPDAADGVSNVATTQLAGRKLRELDNSPN
jgi:hypothetical protein